MADIVAEKQKGLVLLVKKTNDGLLLTQFGNEMDEESFNDLLSGLIRKMYPEIGVLSDVISHLGHAHAHGFQLEAKKPKAKPTKKKK